MKNSIEALNTYSDVGVRSSVSVASPHRLIEMLFSKAQEHLNVAIGSIQRGDLQRKAHALGKVLDILEYLRVCIDPGIDGDFADQLAELYAYMERTVTEANLEDDPGKLEEVLSLLAEVKSGWTGIPEEYKVQ